MIYYAKTVNIMRFCVLNKCTKEKYSIKYILYINNILYTLPESNP